MIFTLDIYINSPIYYVVANIVYRTYKIRTYTCTRYIVCLQNIIQRKALCQQLHHLKQWQRFGVFHIHSLILEIWNWQLSCPELGSLVITVVNVFNIPIVIVLSYYNNYVIWQWEQYGSVTVTTSLAIPLIISAIPYHPWL